MKMTREYLLRSARFYTVLFLSSILVVSCGNNNGKKTADIFTTDKFDEDDFVATLSASLGRDTTDYVAKLYKANGYYPLWLGEDGSTGLAEQMVAEVDSLKWDGLSPELYNAGTLRKQLDVYRKTASPDLADVIRLDTALTNSYYKASRHLLLGRLVPKRVDSLWYHTNDSGYTAMYILPLLKEGSYPSLDSFRSQVPAYRSLQRVMRHYVSIATDSGLLAAKAAVGTGRLADSNVMYVIEHEPLSLPNVSYDTQTDAQNKVSAYQRYYGLKPTGKIDSILTRLLRREPAEVIKLLAANLERLRWMPKTLEREYILVNVPHMELALIRDGRRSMEMNVVVGKPVRQTPSLNANMANIVFNPPWGVPPTILKNDVLPGIQRGGAGYLNKKGLKVYDQKGRSVDAYAVNESNYKRYTFKQDPGDDNALGNVKFNLPNKWDIYLHDTPHRDDFVKSYRALSSGCIRVQQPRELAEYILNEMNGRHFDQYMIDSIVGTAKTKWEVLKNKLPVHIVYLTAFDDGTGSGMYFARDIYVRDEKLMEALGG